MLFQGQEFAASSPFLFFADHGEELAQAVRKGRAKFLEQFPSVALPQMQAQLAPPDAGPRSIAASSISPSAKLTGKSSLCTAI